LKPTQYHAKVIEQSVNSITGDTITTFQIRIPRFVLAQLNKHRILSSNTESNRAVPIKKKDRKLVENPYHPDQWGTNQSGMQAGKPLTGLKAKLADLVWFCSMHSQRFWANLLNLLGVHKEIVNRLTEPFQMVDVVLTGTQWFNFFELRTSEKAQPEIRKVARLMLEAYHKCSAYSISDGGLHLPYVTHEEKELYKGNTLLLIALSASRCARVSYLNHEGNMDVEKDVKLFIRLVSSKHWSALEHTAVAIDASVMCGGFIGWVPARKLFTGESGDYAMEKDTRILNGTEIRQVTTHWVMPFNSDLEAKDFFDSDRDTHQ